MLHHYSDAKAVKTKCRLDIFFYASKMGVTREKERERKRDLTTSSVLLLVGGDVREQKLIFPRVKLIEMCQTIQNDERTSYLVVETDFWGPYLPIFT